MASAMNESTDYPGKFGRTEVVETEWEEELILRELTAKEALDLWPMLEAMEEPDPELVATPFELYAAIVVAGVVKADFSPRWTEMEEVYALPARIIADLAMRILALSEINLEAPLKKDSGGPDVA